MCQKISGTLTGEDDAMAGGRRSEEIEDRRGGRQRVSGLGARGLGIGGVLVLMVLGYLTGGDLSNLLLTFPNLAPDDFAPWVNEDDGLELG